MNIGVFDSGVGGLWILKHLHDKLPNHNFIFIGDQMHVPYGERSVLEIQKFSLGITKFLLEKDCKIIVIACNTASAAALKYLRGEYPEIFFVGMEPAIKPASETTQTGNIGVLATPTTFSSQLYNSLTERYATGVKIYENPCSGLVSQIEKGELDSLVTRNILEKAINPMLEKNVDTIVLGCTHYPFVISLIKEITENKVNIIDPTNAIVRRVESIILENNFSFILDTSKKINIFTTSEIEKMKVVLYNLFDSDLEISRLEWEDDKELRINK